MAKEKEVTFRAKSSWQKDNCIDQNCPNESVLEAVCGNALVRCCENEKCQAMAARLAQASSTSTTA